MAALTDTDVLQAVDPSLLLPPGAPIDFVSVLSQGSYYFASAAQVRAALGIPATIFADTAPANSTPGTAGQQYWHKVNTFLTDIYQYQRGAWVKQRTLGVTDNTLVVGFNSQGQALPVSFGLGPGQANPGTYSLPVSGQDVVGLTNVQYFRNTVQVEAPTAQFVAGDTLTFTVTTSTGGSLTLRQQ